MFTTHKTVEFLYAVKVNGVYLRTKGYDLRTFKCEKYAKNYCKKNSILQYEIVDLVVQEPVYLVKPFELDSNDLQGFESISKILKSGFAKVYQADFCTDTEYKIIRHTPLGDEQKMEECDVDKLIEFNLKMKVDVMKLKEILKVDKHD